MTYKMLPNRMYRMPTHFGPTCGPRQGENNSRFANVDSPRMKVITVSFLTNREQLDALLPEGMGLRVGAEPVVTVEAAYMTEIEWLAGRGYNTLGVQFPAVFDGQVDHVNGTFLTVLWENLTDPIVAGREELGFSKIYAEIPEPMVCQGKIRCGASWLGFPFVDVEVQNMRALSSGELAAGAGIGGDDGTIHFKYIPKTGEWGTPEVACVTFTPSLAANLKILEAWQGAGTIRWNRATWEDMPTQFHIVNALSELEIIEYRGAQVLTTVGAKDLSDQRILR